jgi:hypothetical protein
MSSTSAKLLWELKRIKLKKLNKKLLKNKKKGYKIRNKDKLI